MGTIATDDIYGKDLTEEFSREVVSMADVPVRVVSSQKIPVNSRAAVVRPEVQKVNFNKVLVCVKNEGFL